MYFFLSVPHGFMSRKASIAYSVICASFLTTGSQNAISAACFAALIPPALAHNPIISPVTVVLVSVDCAAGIAENMNITAIQIIAGKNFSIFFMSCPNDPFHDKGAAVSRYDHRSAKNCQYLIFPHPQYRYEL